MNPLAPVFAICLNTFRESLRNKIGGALGFFVIATPLVTFILASLSLGEDQRIATDATIVASSVFAALVSVYSAISLFHVEIERRTIYTILSKPIKRWQYIVGKYAGVILLNALVVPITLLTSLATMWWFEAEITATYLFAYITIFLQAALIAAVSFAFVSVSAPLLAGLFSLATWVIGNLFTQLELAKKSFEEQENPAAVIMDVLMWILPNLEALNLSNQATYATTVPWNYLASASVYTVSYAGICLLISIAAFSRRDFA